MDIDPRLIRRKSQVKAVLGPKAYERIGIKRRTWDVWPEILTGIRKLKAIMAVMDEQDQHKATLGESRIHAVHGDPTFRGHLAPCPRRQPEAGVPGLEPGQEPEAE